MSKESDSLFDIAVDYANSRLKTELNYLLSLINLGVSLSDIKERIQRELKELK